MDGHEILALFSVGGAVLALWVLVRFPKLGPRRPAMLVLATIAAAVELSLAGTFVDAVADVGRFGVAVALLVGVLPSLTAAFWVSGCVLRALADLRGLRS